MKIATKSPPPAAGMDKKQAALVLQDIATLLEMKNENVFKIRAFANAARVLEGCPEDLATLIETGELEKLKGIGKGHIAGILRELYQTGRSSDFEELKGEFPEGIFELLKIPGLGAKRVKVLYEKLKVASIPDLKLACEQNRLLEIEGFGPRMQEKILEGIGRLSKAAGQYLLDEAVSEAGKLTAYLKKVKGIQKIEIAGSLRRSKETVKDIDILISAEDPAALHGAFIRYSGAIAVIAHGDTKSSITLKNGMNCDLRTVTLKEFPYALHYFTGSKEHNVAVRTLAKKKSIKMSEYGMFKKNRLIPCKDEAEIFRTLGLAYIPPEARENTGEIEWAAAKDFPRLVEEKDIRGVFHVHSTYSDGLSSLEQMVGEAEKMGYEYVGISDHSRSARYAGGLEIERVERQWREIDQIQKSRKIRILKGIESDILADGALDYPDSFLKGFDFVIGSIHSRFNMPAPEMTARIKRAMENKYLTYVGHLTGRLLLSREGYRLDMEEILDYALKTGVTIELNANPHRLDLDWRVCRLLKKRGGCVGIHPDAHTLEGMKDTVYGVGIARKAWLEKKDVVNTQGLDGILKFLKRRR